jgi:hypothetical protein
VSSTVLIGGGENKAVGAAAAGLPRGLDITPPKRDASFD